MECNFKNYRLKLLSDEEFLCKELELINYYVSRFGVFRSYVVNVNFQEYDLDLIYNLYKEGFFSYLRKKFPQADYSELSKFRTEFIDYLKENDYWEMAVDQFVKLSIKNATYLFDEEDYYKRQLKDLFSALIREY